jgi:hypothetical protein
MTLRTLLFRRALALPITVVAACSAPDRANQLPLGAGGSSGAPASANRLPLTVVAALDSGNSAMRIDDYSRAIAQYRVAAEGAPDHAAPWFGLYMAAKEVNDSVLADSAMRQVRRITNDTSVLPAHKAVADVAMPPHSETVLPKGHPKPGATPAKPHP